MQLDPPTLFTVVLVGTLTGSLLLLWSWLQNRAERSLLWMAVGFGAVSVGSLLLGSRGRLPDFWTIQVANAAVIWGFTLCWTVGRLFNGKRPYYALSLIGPALWIVACQFEAIYASYEWRVIVAAIIATIYGFAAAIELFRRDGLRSRYPVAGLLAFHSLTIMARIPLATAGLYHGQTAIAFDDAWFAPIALESIVFANAIALLMLSLAKERVEQRLRAAALTDPLTGLPNRRAFFEYGTSVLAQGARRKRPTALIVFDLDRFKEINDTHGHPIGDAVIRAFATAMKTSLRAGDCAGRLGGEEFAAILPDADERSAGIAAERILRAFADHAAAVTGVMSSTTSAGLVSAPASAEPIDAMLVAADRALYEAKRRGGNRVEVATSFTVAAAAAA